ncbi:uncharacterized protein LOC135497835 [Lineus longissimus]|uniref:uncharacterized protein LOC135497835 n=1 Tax=Lineus longissimus TaxID=88925 RepID=UPI002B4C9881
MAYRTRALVVGLTMFLVGAATYQFFTSIGPSIAGRAKMRVYSDSATNLRMAAKLGRSMTSTAARVADHLVELGDCATFRASAPIYAHWKLRADLPNVSLSDPLKSIFHYGIFIDPNVTLAAKTRKPEDGKYVVPNIQHYAWYSDNSKNVKVNLRFHHYLSMLSAQKFNKPDCVYFWYEKEPTGELWEKLKNKLPNLIMVYREGPTSIYGNVINLPEHKSDVVRLEALLKYGGLYTDLDVLVLKPLTDLRVHDMTMGYESAGEARNWLCNGIMQAKPNATFLRIWYKRYEKFNDGNWGGHSVRLPAKLAKEFPKLIHTEIDTFNRPNWQEVNWLYKDGKIWDWSRSYTVHLWFRFYNKEHNLEDIKTINTTMGQLFRFVVYGKIDLIGKDKKVTAFSL